MSSAIKVELLERRPFYDSTWHVALGAETPVVIVRDEYETEASMRRLLEHVQSTDDIRALDMKAQLYYD